MRLVTDDAPGLRIGPTAVLVISLVYIAAVVLLHIWGTRLLLLALQEAGGGGGATARADAAAGVPSGCLMPQLLLVVLLLQLRALDPELDAALRVLLPDARADHELHLVALAQRLTCCS